MGKTQRKKKKAKQLIRERIMLKACHRLSPKERHQKKEKMWSRRTCPPQKRPGSGGHSNWGCEEAERPRIRDPAEIC